MVVAVVDTRREADAHGAMIMMEARSTRDPMTISPDCAVLRHGRATRGEGPSQMRKEENGNS